MTQETSIKHDAREPIDALSVLLRRGSGALHERLDRRIMALSPFASRQRFTRFVRMQLRLSIVTAPLYEDAGLRQWLPSLTTTDRLDTVLADCCDLGVSDEMIEEDRAAASMQPTPEQEVALGWIYTQEGSSLGAAVLLKIAREQLGLSETFGARHLAGAQEGRLRYWRRLTGDMDVLILSESQRKQALGGARDAFDFVYRAVESLYRDVPCVDDRVQC